MRSRRPPDIACTVEVRAAQIRLADNGRTRKRRAKSTGPTAGYARILALRAQLIASGAHVAAPCPHDGPCPLIAPDWCHFTQRLPRSQAHRQIKGAEVPYEDEKFAYLALTRAPVPTHPARVLAQPVVSKVEVTAKLCTADGVVVARIPRRAKADYGAARRWRWGDAVMEQG